MKMTASELVDLSLKRDLTIVFFPNHGVPHPISRIAVLKKYPATQIMDVTVSGYEIGIKESENPVKH